MYFFDNNFPDGIPIALAHLCRAEAIHLRELFSRDTVDQLWIPVVAQAGYTIITADRNIRRIPLEWRALRENNGTAIFIKGAIHNLSIEEKAVWFIRNWSKIEALRLQPGDCVEVAMNFVVAPVRQTLP